MHEINSSRHHVFGPKTNLEDLYFRMHILIVSNSNLKLQVFGLYFALWSSKYPHSPSWKPVKALWKFQHGAERTERTSLAHAQRNFPSLCSLSAVVNHNLLVVCFIKLNSTCKLWESSRGTRGKSGSTPSGVRAGSSPAGCINFFSLSFNTLENFFFSPF